MNPLEKNALLQKIEIEIKALDALKRQAFLKCAPNQLLRDRQEFDRLDAKMDGVFLVRHLILESISLEADQERPKQENNSA